MVWFLNAKIEKLEKYVRWYFKIKVAIKKFKETEEDETVRKNI